MDVARFFTKWCQDVEDAQRPDGAFTDVSPFVCCGSGTAAWGDAGVICPWTIYRVYGDRRILERHYAHGARWIEYLRTHSKDLLRPADRLRRLAERSRADTPKDVLATAYFGESTRSWRRWPPCSAKTGDQRKYEELFAANQERPSTKPTSPKTAASKATPRPATSWPSPSICSRTEKRALAARYLVEDIKAKGNHLSHRLRRRRHLMPTLTGWATPTSPTRCSSRTPSPSGSTRVKNGATTIWERWDGWTKEKGFQDPGMNSFNHYSLGTVGEWLFDTVAGLGLDPQVPGFKKIVIRPRAGGGMSWAKAEYDSMHGRIVSDWKIEGGQFRLVTTIPANTTALIYVPAANAESVQESGTPVVKSPGVKFERMENGAAVFSVGSGSYQFTAPAR